MKGAYIIIQEWMLELGLQPTELLVFARIASFSASKKPFTGGVPDLCKWAARDSGSVRSALKKLREKGFIVAIPNPKDNRLYVYGVAKKYYQKLVTKIDNNFDQCYSKRATISTQNEQDVTQNCRDSTQNEQQIIKHNKNIIKEDTKGVRTHERKEEEYLPNGQKKMTLEEYLAANPLNDVEAFWERQRKRIEATKEEMRKNRRPVKNNPS